MAKKEEGSSAIHIRTHIYTHTHTHRAIHHDGEVHFAAEVEAFDEEDFVADDAVGSL